MRNLTAEEQAALHRHCIFCKQDLFYEGPMGGLSLNVYCAVCSAGYNITHEKLPWQLIAGPGELPDFLVTPAPATTMERLRAGLNEAIEKSMREAYDRIPKRH